MPIVTGQGDAGRTRLGNQQEVAKDDPRIAALGDGDELQAVLGWARCMVQCAEARETLASLAPQLKRLLAEVALFPAVKGRPDTEPLGDRETLQLTKACERLEQRMRLRRTFMQPRALAGVAALDMARAVARRFERSLAGLARQRFFDNEAALAWSNRLSDYLWLLMRLEEHDHGSGRGAYSLNLSRR